ncbi:hypothetical protein E4T38_01924 [Aureobasidium subglaciale]|nr:hypothetical protein E4T38_01924 [Aureobasidium subglaciale]KAI5229275.1 hypothetical protein E4T40_01556 [Aureobasidium subglaciale]KAI5233016.1 hypothetical protein E4T41_01922 [Aureobasidium subglaciale]KAI5266396.1 hypothetical protein E4T46_01553 [Aureobasidium subglaciale]
MPARKIRPSVERSDEGMGLPPSSQVGVPIPSSQMTETSQSAKKLKKYRPVGTLPYELQDIINVYIEEQLFSQAISLLMNTLIAGTDGTVDGRTLPAYVSSPQVLAVVATLAVHPSWTNRSREPESVKIANDALFLLKHVNSIIGAANANFASAFKYLGKLDPRDRQRRTGDVTIDGDDDGKFQIDLANKGAIWNLAEDFWAVVGWAFNCSCQYPKRWERWRPWLEFMLDALEDDLQERASMAEPLKKDGKEAAANTLLSESLIAQYCLTVGDGRAGKRRVMRAILANGCKKDLDEFHEIWKNETKPPKEKKQEELVPRKKIDFENEEYGDYMDMDESEEEEEDLPPTPKATTSGRHSRRRARPSSATPDADEEGESSVSSDYGGFQAIQLRQRLIALTSFHYQHAFMEAEDCFDLVTEFIRPLPLDIFTLFVTPSSPWLEPHSHASLCQNLLRPIISSEAPTYHADTMTQIEFEKHFLPYPANYTNYVENARVSLLVEALLRLLFRHSALIVNDSLKKKLDEGIKAREVKARSGGRKLVGLKEAEEEKAVKMLANSAMRMKMVVQVASAQQQ